MKTTEILAMVIIVALCLANYASYKIGWRRAWNVGYEAGRSWGKTEGRRETMFEALERYGDQCNGKGDELYFENRRLTCVHANGTQNTLW